MQLNLAFLDPPNLPVGPLPPSLAPIAWEHLDEAAARSAALDILALLGASHE